MGGDVLVTVYERWCTMVPYMVQAGREPYHLERYLSAIPVVTKKLRVSSLRIHAVLAP